MNTPSLFIRSVSLIGAAALSVVHGFAQQGTGIDLARQGRNVDFSQAPRTRPIKTGASLPVTCQTGDLFFKTDATVGQNLHACVTTNSWAILSGGGSASAPTSSLQLNDMKVTRSTAHILILNEPCLSGTPCNYRIGSVARSITEPSALTLESGSGPGVAYVYLDANGLKIGLGGQLDASCTGGCTVLPASTGFPPGSIPLFTWSSTTTQGQWDVTGQDLRGLLNTQPFDVGPGLTRVNDSSGAIRIELDSLALPQVIASLGTPTGGCTPGRDFHLNTGSGTLSTCPAGSWRLAAATTTGSFGSVSPCQAENQGQMFWSTETPGYFGTCGASQWTWRLDHQTVLPPPALGWTAVNGASLSAAGGAVSWQAAAANGEIQAILRPVPAATPYMVTFGLQIEAFGDSAICGALWTSGTDNTSAAHTVGLTSAHALQVTRWTNLATSGTQDLASRTVLGLGRIAFFRLSDDGTERVFSYSNNGSTFQKLATVDRNSPFTPSFTGVFCRAAASTAFQGLLVHAGGLD